MILNSNIFAANIYNNAQLKDINLSSLNFRWYPLKINITEYYDYASKSFKKWKLNKSTVLKSAFVQFIFEDWNKVIVPTKRVLFSTKIGGVLNTDADVIVDMPLYLKNSINYWYTVKAKIKLLDNESSDINNPFLLETWNIYTEKGRTIWLIYNTNNITSENQFLPRKVLVKLYDGTKLLRSQVIDVFKNWKLSVHLNSDENITKMVKQNFYVVGNTNAKDYWYANGPVISKITCPKKITTATTCKVTISAFDSWTVKLYIQDKYNDNKYQFWSWDITANWGTVTKDFTINPALGYPDGEYKIIWESYKNEIRQQHLDQNEFVIDRFKPSFADVFPTLYIPDNVSWSAVINIKVSERLKADPIGLKCDYPVTAVQRDNTNPFLYHITVNIPSSKHLIKVNCKLTDIWLNTNIQTLYIKRYKDWGNMGITWINPIVNWLDMTVSNMPDQFIPTSINSIWKWLINLCQNWNCSDKISWIETYINSQNTTFWWDKQILISGWDNWNIIYKLYPDTEVNSTGYKGQIINITSDYIWNYWEVDSEWNYYKNNVLLWNKSNLLYYNIYNGSYVIEYDKNDWLYIDTQKIDTNIFSDKYLWVDIIKPIDQNNVYMVWLNWDTHNLDYFRINLLTKEVKKITSIKINANNWAYPTNADFAFYQNKIIVLGADKNNNRNYIAIMPLPQIIIENPKTKNRISYIAHNKLLFWKELYADLWLKALVKWYVLPSIKDCGSGNKVTIGWSTYQFDTNPWCNIKELNLDKTQDINRSTPKMYYQQSLDDYTFNSKFNLYVSKFWIDKSLGEINLKLQNKPTEYRLWFVKADNILTKKNSPGWSYLKYDDKTFLALPQIVHYSMSDLKNGWFYIYKKNLKIQSLMNKTWLYYPVVVYKTAYNTSEVRILGISTIKDYITDPKTWKYIAVKRVIYNKPYMIDTVAPIFFDMKTNNTNPSIWDKIAISFKTTEKVNLKNIKIWNVDLDISNLKVVNSNNIYYYELDNVTITKEMFDKQWQLWLFVSWYDQANNYNEKKMNIAGLKWWLTVSSLNVWKIESAWSIHVQNMLVTNDKNVQDMNNINVLTDKEILTNKTINVSFPKTKDWKIDENKLFSWAKILDILSQYTKDPLNLHKYILSIWKNLCQYSYISSSKEFDLGGDCWFIRNRVYKFNSDLRINQVFRYQWYTTLFVNWDVYIDHNIIAEKWSHQNILWIITTGNVYISPNVTHVQAIIKTEKNIYVNK